MIAGGAALVSRYEWVLYLFAAFLVFTGIKMFAARHENEQDIADNRLLAWLRRRLPVTETLHGHAFFVRQSNKTGRTALHVTPLFLALVMIELADVVFAVDSVPAIFAITTDPISSIRPTSSPFWACGRCISPWRRSSTASLSETGPGRAADLHRRQGDRRALMGLDKIPPAVSLSVTAAILAAGVGYSLWRTRSDVKPG